MSWQAKAIPALILLGIFVLSWRVWRLHRLRRRFADPMPLEFPYRARASLLSQGERAFYRVLLEAVGPRYTVCCKVRLGDVLECWRSAWPLGYGRLIAQKHLDFVLVEPGSMRVVSAVELDDRSHARPARRARDEFVNRAMRSVGVPLYRVRAASSYDAGGISRLLSL